MQRYIPRIVGDAISREILLCSFRRKKILIHSGVCKPP